VIWSQTKLIYQVDSKRMSLTEQGRKWLCGRAEEKRVRMIIYGLYEYDNW
jgi:hypothetical protein